MVLNFLKLNQGIFTYKETLEWSIEHILEWYEINQEVNKLYINKNG